MPDPQAVHRREMGRLLRYLACSAALAASSYALPQAEAVQPWIPGEPVPLVRLLRSGGEVREDSRGDLFVAAADPAASETTATVAVAPAAADRSPASGSLPARPPAVATPLEVPPGALDAWFAALARAEAGEPGTIARALHWGDSTIAGDGIAGTVRRRLQARFGDGGPGFLAVHVDPRWAARPDVARWTKGDWETKTITFGGAGTARYGLAGTVSTATGQASSTLGGRKEGKGRQRTWRFDVFYQLQPGGGSVFVKPREAPGVTLRTASEGTADAFWTIEVPAGAETLAITTGGDGPVTMYGVALEARGPGVTWENLGVAGAGQGSMFRQNGRHVARQVQRRNPRLVVYQSGGNELGYPSLKSADGALYAQNYVKVVQRLRAGAPGASCLVVAPLDQAVRVRGVVQSKPMLDRMIAIQRRAAAELGCAFWDSRAAMGGPAGFSRFLSHSPPLAWSDLAHLTDKGLDLIGNCLADAMLAEYDLWRREHPGVAAAEADTGPGAPADAGADGIPADAGPGDTGARSGG